MFWLPHTFLKKLIYFIKGLNFFYEKKVFIFSYFRQWYSVKEWRQIDKLRFLQEQERRYIASLEDIDDDLKYCNLKEYYQWNIVKDYFVLFSFLSNESFFSWKYYFNEMESRDYLLLFGPCFLKFNHIDFFRRKKILIKTIFFTIPLLIYIKNCFYLFYYIFIIMLCVNSTRCRHLEGVEFARNDKELSHYRIVYIYEKLPIERWFLNDESYKFLIDDFFDFDFDGDE